MRNRAFVSGDPKFAAIGHGVSGIDGQIQDCHFELHLVAQNTRGMRAKINLYPYGWTQCTSEKLAHARQQRRKIDLLMFELLRSRERQQLRGDVSNAMCNFQTSFCPTMHSFRFIGPSPD